MKKTGELLKKAREAKGLSLNEIGLSLKISSKVLKAIEDGDEGHLPAKTFLRGFVQSYAAFLRMDVDAVMASFYEEVGSTRPKPLMRTTSEEIDPSTTSAESNPAEAAGSSEGLEKKSEERIAKQTSSAREQDHLAPINEKNNTKSIIIAVIGAVLLGFILFTKKMIDKYSKEAQVDDKVSVSEPLPSTTNAADSNSNEPAPGEMPDEKLESTHSSEPAKADAPKAEPSPSVIASLTHLKASPTPSTPPPAEPAPTQSPTPIPKASVTPTPSVSPSPSPEPSASPSPSPSPAKTPEEKPASKSIELIIEALDNVEVEYSSNTGKTSSIKLTAEQVHTFKSKNGLKLSISNGGAVNLILNGRDLGIPGDLGKPINLSY